MREFVAHPLYKIGLGIERFPVLTASLAHTSRTEAPRTEKESAPTIAAVGLTATDVAESPIDPLIAIRVVADRRYAVADVTVPV